MNLADINGLAIFDIGSNAVRLTTYQFHHATPHLTYKDKALCEMGRHLGDTGHLDPDGANKAFMTIERYLNRLRKPEHACTHAIAVATEALRRAADGPDFIKRLKDTLSLDVTLLTEEEEGRLGATGVLRDLPHANGLVADLGGGSLQLTRVMNGKIFDTISMPLGGLRLKPESDQLEAYCETYLNNLPDTLNHADHLYIIGGSWRSLAQLCQQRAGIFDKNLQGLELDPSRVHAVIKWLHELGDKAVPTLMQDYHFEPSRAELVPVCGRLLVMLGQKLGARKYIISSAGLRDGILQSVIDGSITPVPLPHTLGKTTETR
jgi:exopolyphosphatase / guanosine-5'-triphosphate,3'-diphosphate pyrophosphatase